MNTRVTLSGVELKNPIIAASGTIGYGYEFFDVFDLNILGSISIKGTTREPRYGNIQPRIAETPSGMLNAVGLQNPGIDAVVTRELPRLYERFKAPVIANICGFSVDEYRECAARIDKSDGIGIIEVNISCPNVHCGGMSFGSDPEKAAEVTRAVKDAATKPVYIKLSPNVTDIVPVAKACEDAGADGLSLINTLLGMRIDIKRREPVLGNVTGGLSGPAVLPVALRMVWQVYEAVSIPIIGLGGVSSAEDAVEMMLAGASAVEVGAAGLRDPWVYEKIVSDLPKLMDRLGVTDINELTGGAHNG